jgi:ribosomal protein S18 acetylase RimI-like enzyme
MKPSATTGRTAYTFESSGRAGLASRRRVAQTAGVFAIRPLEPSEVEAVVRVWNETKRDTYDFIPIERNRTFEEDLGFFRASVLPECRIWVAAEGARIVGFLALRGSYVDRLYVQPGAQRSGVGTALLHRALEASPAGIELHTHVKNGKARAFYEKHGMRAVRFGVSPQPESEPDVEYHWRP